MSAGLNGTVDVLAFIDKTVDNVEDLPALGIWRNTEVLEMLADIRDGLTSDPDWSDVGESNLRAQLQAAKDDAAAVHISSEIAAALYDSVIAGLERQLESARRIAVALEQENAEKIPDPAGSEECRSELWSWDYFRPEQTDGYWMQCHLLGPHAEHENSETGARWSDPKPEGEGNVH